MAKYQENRRFYDEQGGCGNDNDRDRDYGDGNGRGNDSYYPGCYGKFRALTKELKRFEGQPVKIFTDDGRALCGIDEEVVDGAVRIIDKCGRQIFIELAHIDSVVEPQMRLKRCCEDHCDCDDNGRDRDYDRDCD